jgi:mRNA-degrading endonuclease toxin of MazEF toxin-antitoxin module
VLTRDEAIPGLRNVVVALVTSRQWGLNSEAVLGPEDGMPQECAIR